MYIMFTFTRYNMTFLWLAEQPFCAYFERARLTSTCAYEINHANLLVIPNIRTNFLKVTNWSCPLPSRSTMLISFFTNCSTRYE